MTKIKISISDKTAEMMKGSEITDSWVENGDLWIEINECLYG